MKDIQKSIRWKNLRKHQLSDNVNMRGRLANEMQMIVVNIIV